MHYVYKFIWLQRNAEPTDSSTCRLQTRRLEQLCSGQYCTDTRKDVPHTSTVLEYTEGLCVYPSQLRTDIPNL